MKTNSSLFSTWQTKSPDQLDQETPFNKLPEKGEVDQIILSFLNPRDAAQFAQTSKKNHQYVKDFRCPLARRTIIEKLRLQGKTLPRSIVDNPLCVEHLNDRALKEIRTYEGLTNYRWDTAINFNPNGSLFIADKNLLVMTWDQNTHHWVKDVKQWIPANWPQRLYQLIAPHFQENATSIKFNATGSRAVIATRDNVFVGTRLSFN